MDKDAQIKIETTPCEVCGKPCTEITGSATRCAGCASRKTAAIPSEDSVAQVVRETSEILSK